MASKNLRLYIDGVEVASNLTTAFTRISSTDLIRIGSGYGGGRFFNGLIGEVSIYDKALSVERVQAHFQAADKVPRQHGRTASLE